MRDTLGFKSRLEIASNQHQGSTIQHLGKICLSWVSVEIRDFQRTNLTIRRYSSPSEGGP
jgi:hypothetical protein